MGAIIFDKNGARVEGVKGAVTSLAEIAGETAGLAMDKLAKREGKDEAES